MRRRAPTMAAAAMLVVATLGLPPAGATPADAPDPADATTPAARFVWAAHADFVDRAPTATELEALTSALDTGATTRRAIVTGLVTSPEWVATIVDRLYLDTLGRPADAAGRAHWIDRIRSGTTTVAQAAAAFYASPEYFRGLGGGTVATWIDDLYLKILGRPADAAGRTHWIDETTRTTRTSVAHRFHQSREPVRLRVTGLYRSLLGRAPDPTGLAHWTARLPRLGDLALARELAASTEYANRANRRFGPGTIIPIGLTNPYFGAWGSISSISGDGRHVVWSEAGPDGRGRILGFDRSTGTTTTIIAEDHRNLFFPAISADGRRVAYSSHDAEDDTWAEGSRVEVWDRATGERTVVADGAEPFTHLAIDATGDHVAYRAPADGVIWEAWLWERDSGSTQITDGNGWTTALALSGDGQRLAIGTQATDLVPGDPGAGTFLWDSSSGLQRITDDAAFQLSISGDGSTVVFDQEGDHGVDVVAWTPDGGTELVASVGWWITPQSVSHDGRYVAVSDPDEDGRYSALVVDRLLDRTHRAPSLTPAILPTISADGSTIAYLDAEEHGLGDRYLWERPGFGR